jgi:hypothetical protein
MVGVWRLPYCPAKAIRTSLSVLSLFKVKAWLSNVTVRAQARQVARWVELTKLNAKHMRKEVIC